MLTVFGSLVLDTIRTPDRVVTESLGGAAVYAGVSASFFTRTGFVGVAGTDCPARYLDALADRLDMRGLHVADGKTFRYECMYDRTLTERETLRTELNVQESYRPAVPEQYRGSDFVYLSNNDPEQNLKVVREFDDVKFSMCDTINFWIETKRDAVIRMIGAVDAVVINYEEARLLTKEYNVVRCAKRMMDWGARYVIIKKAEHGALLFFDDVIFPTVGVPLETVADPTGAGDSFAGALMGYMADRGSTSVSDLKRGIIYGNVMGSFVVEGYGLERLFCLSRQEIDERFEAYGEMIRF